MSRHTHISTYTRVTHTHMHTHTHLQHQDATAIAVAGRRNVGGATVGRVEKQAVEDVGRDRSVYGSSSHIAFAAPTHAHTHTHIRVRAHPRGRTEG